VQLARDFVHAFVVAQDPLRDGLSDFPYETLHIEILKHEADDGVCEQVRCGQRKHNPRCDVDERLVKVRRILKEKNGRSDNNGEALRGRKEDIQSNCLALVRMPRRTADGVSQKKRRGYFAIATGVVPG
jgi:hypothetical protein